MKFYEEEKGFRDFQRLYYTDDKKVYRFEDLHNPKVEAVILEAGRLWTEASSEYIKLHGDTGSCVLGNGIFVALKPPRRRNIYKLKLASPQGQGEGPGEGTKDPVLKYLKDNGIDCWYECGRMD